MNKEEIEQRLKFINEELDIYNAVGISEDYKRYKNFKKQKKQLKKQLNELPSLEVGKWYKQDNAIAFYKGWEVETYGLNLNGKFISDAYWFASWTSKESDWTPATDKEVKTALIKEAKSRGFKEGVKYKTDYSDFKRLAKGDLIMGWAYDKYSLNFKGSFGLIFSKGKWAEIIEQPKTVSLSGDYTKIQLTDIINNRFNDER